VYREIELTTKSDQFVYGKRVEAKEKSRGNENAKEEVSIGNNRIAKCDEKSTEISESYARKKGK